MSDTINGGPLPTPSSVTVSVLDGTGTYNRATTTSAELEQLGFDVVGTGYTPSVASQSETLVTYSQRTPADLAAAQAVADSISGAVSLAYEPTTDGAQVTVTTGTDFSVDAPAPAPATATTPSTTAPRAGSSSTVPTSSTSTTTTLASNGAFSAPTSSVEPLQSWDPRSCTPSGGEGP
jgi:hypothetical protein